MKIRKNVSLKPYNQFGVDAKAKYFGQPVSVSQVLGLIRNPQLSSIDKLILGGGNNVLFINDFGGLVIKPEIKGRMIYKKNDNQVLIGIGAGEDWDELVRWMVDQDWGGIENLVMIPGTVGGAVSQNIGAYGQEICDVVAKVEAINLLTGKEEVFDNQDCQFSYRSSIFKEKLKNKYLITYLWLKLTPVSAGYQLNCDYDSLQKQLEKEAEKPYTLKEVVRAVIEQRKKNLPSVEEYGTCGCFFTNPIIKKEKYQDLKKIIADLVSYPSGNNDRVKIPAGKLIDELGWKGKWEERVGVSEKHALCIVTRRQASGKEILDFAEKIRQNVIDSYGVRLDFEVNIV